MPQLVQQQQQSQTAELYLPFVRKIAGRIARRVPSSVDVDDLVAAGTVGLMEALERYDPRGGRSFETYAEFRVKGAMLDELRRADPLNRAARAAQGRIASKTAELTAELGRQPSSEEVAHAIRMTGRQVDFPGPLRVTSVDTQAFEVSSDAPDQEHQVAQREMMQLLRDEIAKLPERQQLVLSLVYIEGVSQVQTADILGVTESRVSQILSSCRRQLRAALKLLAS